MLMDTNAQKRLAAKVMKVGVSRVRIIDQKEADEAITRNDIRRLIVKGVITKINKRGTSRQYSGYRLSQKKKGRRVGKGSLKGRKFSKKKAKDHWMGRVRAQRRMLKEMRDDNIIELAHYRKLYYMVKGGAFRNKNHLLYYMKSNEIIKERKGAVREKKA